VKALRIVLAFVITALAVGAPGCGQDFDPGSRITALRVIAVSADARWDGKSSPNGQAWAKPGETVQLQALWYVPPSDVRGRTWVWTRCVDPEATTVIGCMAAIALELQHIGTDRASQEAAFAKGESPFLTLPPLDAVGGIDIPHVAVKVPEDTLTRLPEEARRNSTVGVLAIVCPGKVVINLEELAVRNAIPLKCLEDGTGRDLPLEEWVIGIKRIFVRETDRNANPSIAQITWDGADWPESEVKEVSPCETDGNRFDRCDGQEQHTVAAVTTSDSFESGTDSASNTHFTEQVIVQYYSTEGIFEHEVKIAQNPPSAWVARPAARDLPGGLVDMWFIVRDNRGGVTWAQRKVHVK
jgi:hypothetical protein